MAAMLIFGVAAGFWIGIALQQAGFTPFWEEKPPVLTYRPPPSSAFSF